MRDRTISFTAALLAASTVGLAAFGATAHAQQAPQAPNMTFFVTSAALGKGGDLGGINGADAHCQTLATTVGAGNKTWRAYLSTAETPNAKGINARDRIGKGPWQNAKGVVIAQMSTTCTAPTTSLAGKTCSPSAAPSSPVSATRPVWHDALTGSQPDGPAFPGNMNLTCNNWSSSEFGKAMLGHIDRRGGADNDFQRSWNSTHQSRGCSQADLVATGGNGLYYCFAQ